MLETKTLQIYWHESQPIYSLTFQPSKGPHGSSIPRLVTAGGDNKVRVWQLNTQKDTCNKIESIDFMCSLVQHEQAVNVARFNPNGDILATAGDDGLLLTWEKNESIIKEFGVEDEEFEDFKESWRIKSKLRAGSATGPSEIYDLAWSPCGKYIVTGSMDNNVRIYNVEEKVCCAQVSDHNHYVQGVVWDPQNEYIISQSADRSVHIYKIIRDANDNLINGLKLHHKITKGELPKRAEGENCRMLQFADVRSSYLFHNETLPSFFRRPAISPCGNVLCVPAGIFKTSGEEPSVGNNEFANAVYIYTRSSLKHKQSTPVMALPFLRKPALVVKFCPTAYELQENSTAWLKLPYKLVFAVATSTEVFIYDTENERPIAIIGNLHYNPLTDLTWSKTGDMLMVSSTDGFCSCSSLNTDLFGVTYKEELNTRYVGIEHMNKRSASSSCKSKTPIRGTPPKKQQTLAEVTQNLVTIGGSLINTEQKVKQKRRIQPTLVADKKDSA
ncbi:HGR066Cp [Eremothecium sinecaudum]|uniref:HGR066Cp n=1 Tax=Eremothecium sinecaudum TaxID=45286 RepID=A0A0X8HVT5_9SACH|nr:HGR066Cp [Eremothecium sinecaudum]AMD22405.1 HGR066Cp [Eremothecium sinecaudum]